MEHALKEFGNFLIEFAQSIDNLSPTLKKELYPFVALVLTILFVRAHYISHYRLAWKSQRKAALYNDVQKAEIQQVRFLVVGPIVLCAFLAFAYFYARSGPNSFGMITDQQVLLEKASNVQTCESAMRAGNWEVAEKAVRNKAVGLTMYHDYKHAHQSMSSLLASLANLCIIYTGAMFSILPFLVLMVVHTLLYPFRLCFKDIWRLPTRFFDVVIPVVNIVTVLSLLVFIVFHLMVDSWRAGNCLWTSGHWYTYVITTLCFIFVLFHLILNEPQQYAGPYAAWFAVQQVLSLSALKETQRFFHSTEEALDGVRYALLLFPLLVVLGGYIARRQCLPPSLNPVESAKRVEAVEVPVEPAQPVADTIRETPTVREQEAKQVIEPAYEVQSEAQSEDYVHVADEETVGVPPAPLDGPPPAPEGPPPAPGDIPSVPSHEPRALKPTPKPPGGPSESSKRAVASFDPSNLATQLQDQRRKMRSVTSNSSHSAPLEGLALQLRNIRALVNPDAGLEREAMEEDWE